MRIFLEECPPELEALRERVACRQMVTRNVLALAAGVTLTLCWDLAPEIPHYRDRLNMLGFLSGTFALLDFDQGWGLTRERPAAKTLRMVSRQLTGAGTVACRLRSRARGGGAPAVRALPARRR
jgi:hypothetical protein